MNRRQFFKTVATTVAGAVAVGVAPRVVRGESDRSVVWGEACCDSLPNLKLLFVPYRRKSWGWASFYVQTTEPIKKGEALVWNPDGTVRHYENQNPKTRRSTHPLHCDQEGPETQTWNQGRFNPDASGRTVS